MTETFLSFETLNLEAAKHRTNTDRNGVQKKRRKLETFSSFEHLNTETEGTRSEAQQPHRLPSLPNNEVNHGKEERRDDRRDAEQHGAHFFCAGPVGERTASCDVRRSQVDQGRVR